MNFNKYCKDILQEELFFYLPAYYSDIWNIKYKFWLDSDEIIEVKKLLWEIFQISKWINDLLNLWNLISAVILLRTLLERIILFRVIFEDKDKIVEKIKIYVDFWLICAYEWLNKYNDKSKIDSSYFDNLKNVFDKHSVKYLVKKWNKTYYDLYKWLWITWSITSNYNKYIKYELEKKWDKIEPLYIIISKIHHWNSLNISLLWENSFLPNNNNSIKNDIKLMSYGLLELLSKDLEIEI